MSLTDRHLNLFKELYDLKGQKIRFETKLGLYEGFIDYLMPLNQAVSFKNAYYVPTNEFAGCLRFLLEDFISYKVVELSELEKYEKWDYVTRILENRSVGPKYRITDIFDDLEEESASSVKYVDEIEEEEFVLELPPYMTDKLPCDSVILDAINSEFQEAIDYILRQNIIGVSFEGPRISRIGHLSWVCISTSMCIFLFDIELLGESAFDEGLRKIFQDKNLQKVIHDCRLPADCLTHLFATKLANVFDTQVADYFVNTLRYKGESAYKYISSLDCCLVNYLDVPQEFLINRKGYYSYQAELNFFRVRPVSNEYRTVLIKNVVYLILLKEILYELMLSPFRKAVDLHLGVLANASEEELLLIPHNPNEISPTVLMHGIQTVRYSETAKAPPLPLLSKFKDPVKGTIVELNEITKGKKKDILFSETKTSWEMEQSGLNMHDENTEMSSITDFNNSDEIYSNERSTVKCLEIKLNRRRIDDTYHELVHNLHNCRISGNELNVKPLQSVVTLKVMRSLNFLEYPGEHFSMPRNENNSDILFESDLENSRQIVGDLNSKINPNGNNLDASPKLYEALPVSNVSENSVTSNDKVCFIPSGMEYRK